MDRPKFVATAPIYYSLAIASYLRNHDRVSIREVRDSYVAQGAPLLDPLIEPAIKWLLEQGMIVAVRDDFGPTIFERSPDYDVVWDRVATDRTQPFFKIDYVANGAAWLQNALLSINDAYSRLSISEGDFSDARDDDWAPLPLDRSDKRLRNAIDALDQTIEGVRADNGYAATVSAERDFVLGELSEASRVLKEEKQTSIGFLRKRVLEPLEILGRRFSGAALSAIAAGARDAIIEFVKQHGEHLLRLLWPY